MHTKKYALGLCFVDICSVVVHVDFPHVIQDYFTAACGYCIIVENYQFKTGGQNSAKRESCTYFRINIVTLAHKVKYMKELWWQILIRTIFARLCHKFHKTSFVCANLISRDNGLTTPKLSGFCSVKVHSLCATHHWRLEWAWLIECVWCLEVLLNVRYRTNNGILFVWIQRGNMFSVANLFLYANRN